MAQIEAPNNFEGDLLYKFETDSIPQAGIRLKEVILFQPLSFKSMDELRQYVILRNRTLRVYPYAKLASDRLDTLSMRLENINSNRKKKTYINLLKSKKNHTWVYVLALNYLAKQLAGKLEK